MSAAGTQARVLRDLHADPPLILPNAWDPASAVAIESAGAKAIATTSAGVSWSAGVPDGGGLSRAAALEAIRRIVAVVSVPVTADIETGYGATPEEVASTITEVVAAGVAGVNLEDGDLDPGLQAERLAAAREAAGADLCLNARTDVYLARIGPKSERLDATMARAERYAAAGADVLFVPGLIDPAAIRTLAGGPLPLNVMAHPGAPSIAELAALGVARVSVGSGVAQAAYGRAVAAARELLTHGTYGALEDALDFGRFNRRFRR